MHHFDQDTRGDPVKNLKFGILVFGLLGLIGAFLPFVEFAGKSISLWDLKEADAGQVYLTMGAFLVPLVIGALAVAKGPAMRWHGIVAAAGFALAVVKNRENMEGAIGAKLMLISAVVGLVVAIMVAAKPEKA
jgi:hypothetical protein